MSFNINYHFSISKHPRLAVLWKYQAFSKLIIPLYPILKKCAYFAAIYKRPYHSPLKIEILFSSLCPFFALSILQDWEELHFTPALGKMLQRYVFPKFLVVFAWISSTNHHYFEHQADKNAPIWSNSTNKHHCRDLYYLETWAASGSTPWGRPLPLARAAKLLEATLPGKKRVKVELVELVVVTNVCFTRETRRCLSRASHWNRNGVFPRLPSHILGRVLQAADFEN